MKKFTRKEALTLQTISIKGMKKGDSLKLKAISEIRTVSDPKDGEKDHVLNVINAVQLETGEEGEVVLPFVVNKCLSRIKPLTGAMFEMVKGDKTGRAVQWSVYSLEQTV